MSALLRASSKYSSQKSSTLSASATAARSTASLSNLLQTICSLSSARLSSPKMVASPSNCKAKAGKNSGSSLILLLMWLTKLRCKCTQPPTSRFSGNWIFVQLVLLQPQLILQRELPLRQRRWVTAGLLPVRNRRVQVTLLV